MSGAFCLLPSGSSGRSTRHVGSLRDRRWCVDRMRPPSKAELLIVAPRLVAVLVHYLFRRSSYPSDGKVPSTETVSMVMRGIFTRAGAGSRYVSCRRNRLLLCRTARDRAPVATCTDRGTSQLPQQPQIPNIAVGQPTTPRSADVRPRTSHGGGAEAVRLSVARFHRHLPTTLSTGRTARDAHPVAAGPLPEHRASPK